MKQKKNQDEEYCKQPLSVNDVADFNEKYIVHENFYPHYRELDQAISKSGSPPTKTIASGHRRGNLVNVFFTWVFVHSN